MAERSLELDSIELAAAIFGTPLKWVAIFAPLAFVFFFTFRIEKMTTAGARMAFYAFSAVMGVSLRGWLSSPARLRAFNWTMAALLVGSLALLI